MQRRVARALRGVRGSRIRQRCDSGRKGGRKKGRRSPRKSIGRRESARINIKDEIKEEEEMKPLISPSTPDTDPDLEELSKPIIIDFTPVPSVALSSALTLLSSSSTH